MDNYKHIPVLLNETIEGLNINPDGIYVDCTMGGAGHSSEILKRLSSKGKLYCFDQDDYAIKKGNDRLSKIGTNYQIINSNFLNIKSELSKLGVDKVDGVLYDLGVSSFQFDIGERGFSYHIEGDLDMRMDNRNPLDASVVVNTYSEEKLREIIYGYGEEKFIILNLTRKVLKKQLIFLKNA